MHCQMGSNHDVASWTILCSSDAFDVKPWKWLYPQIRLLYRIKSKAAINLPFSLYSKAIAALFFIPFFIPLFVT